MFICLTVNSGNFPIRHRGLIMGLLLAFFALAAIVWTLLYQYPMSYHIRTFYLSLAISTGFACLFTLLFIGNASVRACIDSVTNALLLLLLFLISHSDHE